MNDDKRPYFKYTVKIRGQEKWFFGTTEDIALKDFKVEKEMVRNKKD